MLLSANAQWTNYGHRIGRGFSERWIGTQDQFWMPSCRTSCIEGSGLLDEPIEAIILDRFQNIYSKLAEYAIAYRITKQKCSIFEWLKKVDAVGSLSKETAERLDDFVISHDYVEITTSLELLITLIFFLLILLFSRIKWYWLELDLRSRTLCSCAATRIMIVV
jgi:hypothetical protein